MLPLAVGVSLWNRSTVLSISIWGIYHRRHYCVGTAQLRDTDSRLDDRLKNSTLVELSLEINNLIS